MIRRDSRSLARVALLAGLLSLGFFAPGPVPAPWVAADVGGPGQAGSTTFDPANSNWVVRGGGGDIWGTADQFHYAYMPVTGDLIVTARVAALTDNAGGNTMDQWSKAGVMVRDGVAAGAMYSFECFTGNNGTAHQYRTGTGAGAASQGQTGGGAPHRWVRLIRTGNSFQGAYSDDGVTWTNDNAAQTIAMPATANVGLACTAHNNGTLSIATFDNLTITNATGGLYWPLQPPVLQPAVAGPNSVQLTWSAVAGAVTYNVLRGTSPTGPFTSIATVNAPTTTYTDTSVVYPTTYSYVVTATAPVGTTANSNVVTVTPLQPQVTAIPNTGLQTSENLTSTNFTITYNQPAPAGGSVLTVVSNNIAEGTVAAQGLATTPVFNGGGQQIGFTYTVLQNQQPTIDVVVTGVDDAVVDGPIAYTVSVTASNMGVTIPNIALTNQDNDTQGLTFTRTSGLITTESGGQAQFSVFLNRQPFGNVSFSLTSSNVLEGTVLPGTLTFTPTGGQPYSAATGFGGWNVAHDVTVTGVDDTLLDFTVPYTIVTGALQFADTRDQTAFTNAGVTAVPDVACVNLDNEVPPELPTVWGNSGCGLLGLEVLLVLCWRRRRR